MVGTADTEVGNTGPTVGTACFGVGDPTPIFVRTRHIPIGAIDFAAGARTRAPTVSFLASMQLFPEGFMQNEQIHVGQSLRRVQHFLDAHKDIVGAVNSTDARKQLDSVVAQLDETVDEQGTNTRQARAEVHRRQQLEDMLVRKYMTPLAKFARARLQGAPGFAALTPSGNNLTTERLVLSARSMAQAAGPLTDVLTKAKFPATFLEQLRTAADAVKASIDVGASTRVRRTGATKQLASSLRVGRNAVATIDALVSHLILGDERLVREWRAAKRITKAASLPAAVSATLPTTDVAPVTTTAPGAPVAPATTIAPVVPVAPVSAISPAQPATFAAKEVPATRAA